MVATKTAFEAAKWLMANPKIVKAANDAAFGMLTPPSSSRRGRKHERSRSRRRIRPARRRLNFSLPRFFTRGGGMKRGGKPSHAMGRFHKGGHFFKGEDIVPFKTPSKSKVNELLPYHKYGYVDSTEVVGQVNDPECVYLGYAAQCNLSTMFCMLRALIRKLLMKTVNFDAINANLEIPGYLFDDTGTVYKIVLLQKNKDTDAITVKNTWFSASNKTITDIVLNFINDFLDYANGFALYSANYKQELVKFQVYQKDGNTTDFWNFQGEMLLEEMVVHVHCSSTLKLQNRTKSASSSSDAEDVSNNPLIGRRYVMNNLPLVRDDVGRFGAINNQGVRLLRHAEFPANTDLGEPPHPGYFVNCKATCGIKVLPGQIKYGKQTYTRKMKFLRFLKMMRWDEDSNSLSYYNIGPYELIALEEAINVNPTEKIQIAYEINRTTAVYFTEKRKHYSQGTFTTATVSNTT